MEDSVVSEETELGEVSRFQTCLRELALHPGLVVIAAIAGKQTGHSESFVIPGSRAEGAEAVSRNWEQRHPRYGIDRMFVPS